MLGHNADWWNGAMLFALGLVVVAALVVVATQYALVVTQKRETLAAQRELDLYKTSAAVKVAEANRKGVEAGEAASAAVLRAAEANAHAAEANERAEQAHKDAANAQANAAIANENTEKLKAQNLVLQAEVERERSQHLKLEAKLSPRRLSPEDKKALIAALAPFHGQRVRISSILGDSEGRTYAEDFVAVFEAAGWDHMGANGITYSVFVPEPAGIEVTVHQVNANQGQGNSAIAALFAIMEKLHLYGEGGPRMNVQIPPGEVELRVGKKAPLSVEGAVH